MKKPVFPRILLLVLLYCGVFVLLVSIQFAKRGGFTQKIGSFVVNGRYRLPGENEPPAGQNEYYLDGDVHVFFGGMDFSMIQGDDDQSLALIMADETKEEVLPERMIISGESAHFLFPGGTGLEFTTQYSGGALEMRISGVFPEDVVGIELPFKPLRKTGIRETEEGQLSIVSDKVNYSFGLSPIDVKRRLLLIGEGYASYRAIPEKKTFSPEDFTLPQAVTAEAYNETLTRWRDQNFSLWNRTIQDQNNEDMVIALAGEALARGTYRAAMAAVSPAFLRSDNRTYESSVYLGSLEQMYRSLITKDREKIARLSRQINEKSLEFLKEPRVFEYFAARGYNNFIDAGAELVHTIDPAILALDITPGILEGYTDWKNFRPNTENPFERIVDQACFVISESLRKVTVKGAEPGKDVRIFSSTGDEEDTEFNLRLGKALLAYAEADGISSWAGIGRSLVISALSMADAGLASARLYRILSPLENCPKAVSIGTAQNSVWVWTAAQTVSASQQNDVMDITVRFPAGETHYMIIRGIRPFARLQLYNMDFRSDPQFERYDSSGWAYYSQEQVLVLKMKHRTTEELIRIIFREAPRPQPAEPESTVPEGTGVAAEN